MERGELVQIPLWKKWKNLQHRVQGSLQHRVQHGLSEQSDVAKLLVVRRIAAIVGSAVLLGSVVSCSSESQGNSSAEDSAASNTEALSGEGSTDGSSEGAPSRKTNNTDLPSREVLAQRNIPADERMKIASLLMVGVDSFDDALAKLKQGVGGIFITSWADPALLTEEGRNIHALRNLIKRPFAVAVDFEGGSVQRHRQVLGSFPSARKMAQRMTPEQAREQGYRIGRSLITHGITTDFAPVLDVDSSTTDVVGDRAFSDNPQVVADYAGQFAAGLKDAGVTPVFKHFPGHGAADGDTHKGAAVTPPLDQIEKRDLVPYAQLLKAPEGAAPATDVMVGHIIVPGLGDEKLPGTLNPATYDLLRTGQYSGGSPYNGTIYTDDISGMKAITDVTTPPDAAARALAAGADQVLWSTDVPIDAVIEAVQAKLADGSFSLERFEDALLHSQLRFIPELPEIPRAEKQDLATVSVAPKPATPAPVQPSLHDAPAPTVAPAPAPASAAAEGEEAPASAPAAVEGAAPSPAAGAAGDAAKEGVPAQAPPKEDASVKGEVPVPAATEEAAPVPAPAEGEAPNAPAPNAPAPAVNNDSAPAQAPVQPSEQAADPAPGGGAEEVAAPSSEGE